MPGGTASRETDCHTGDGSRSHCLTGDMPERDVGLYVTGILFEEPNPTGSRPRDLIGLYRKWQSVKRPQPAKRSSRAEGGATGAFIQEGNRAPVSKATHALRCKAARQGQGCCRSPRACLAPCTPLVINIIGILQCVRPVLHTEAIAFSGDSHRSYRYKHHRP